MLLVVAATERELDFVEGVETLCCGIGPVEAGVATAFEIGRRRPSAILHIGIAGSHTLEPLSHVIGSQAIYCDVADPKSTLPRVEQVLPDPELVAAAQRALPEARTASIGTTAFVGGGVACDVEAMEGFAVLRAAELAGVPAVEVRTISNAVAEADRTRWRIADALAALAEITPRLVAELESWTS